MRTPKYYELSVMLEYALRSARHAHHVNHVVRVAELLGLSPAEITRRLRAQAEWYDEMATEVRLHEGRLSKDMVTP